MNYFMGKLRLKRLMKKFKNSETNGNSGTNGTVNNELSTGDEKNVGWVVL